MNQSIVKSFWSLRVLKGIKIPFYILIFFNLTMSWAFCKEIEILGGNRFYFEPVNENYVAYFIFIAFTRYAVNKINLTYIISKRTGQNPFLVDVFLNLVLSGIFTALTLIAISVLLGLYGFSIGRSEAFKLVSFNFLFGLCCSFLFSWFLNLKNKNSTLFLLYFLPLIIYVINLPFIHFTSYNLEEVIPFIHEGETKSSLLMIYILVFAALSYKTKKSYFFDHG